MSRKSFSKAFKAEAVKLLEQSGRPAADVARELAFAGTSYTNGKSR